MPVRLRIAVLMAFIFAAAMGYYHLKIFIPHARATYSAKGMSQGYFFGDDAYPIWLTSKEWREHRTSPYSAEMTTTIQMGLFGRSLSADHPEDPPSNYREFAYPAFVDILALPSTWISFPAARIVGAFLLLMLTIASMVVWAHLLDIPTRPGFWMVTVLLTLFSYPVLEGIFAVQLGLFVSFLLAAVVALLQKGQPILAGILLALTTIKPQLVILVALFLLVWTLSQKGRRWKFAGSFAFGIAALYLAGEWVTKSWVTQWLQVVFGYHRYSQPPLAIYLFGPIIGVGLSLALLLFALSLCWRMRRAAPNSADFAQTIANLLTVTVIVFLPGQAVYDHVLLLPGIFLLWKMLCQSTLQTKMVRLMVALTAMAIGWQWLAAAAVDVASLLAGAANLSDAWIFLPIRTAASVPFAILACFVLILRRGTVPRSPKIPN